MKVFRGVDKIYIDKPVATIGIFDGVHIAHQALIGKLVETAQSLKGESTIVTLWPHPRIVLNKEAESLKLLNTLEEKVVRIEKAGIDNLVVLPFNTKFSRTGFDTFIREVLVERLKISHLVVGFNHQFGKNREGNFNKLETLAEQLGFGLSQQEPVFVDSEKVSSSAIRQLIGEGEIRKANHFLGYNFKLSGKVVSGNQKGRVIGFPTANIAVDLAYKLIPKDGVYAVRVLHKNQWIKGMMNIGCRPTLTVDCKESILEVNLFDFDVDIYGEELRIEFVQRIRDEKKFTSIEDLKAQIENDKKAINNILTSETL